MERVKRRTDVTLEKPALLDAVRERLVDRLFPMVRRAFSFHATEIERFLVTRYGADDAGFSPPTETTSPPAPRTASSP